MRIAVISDTHDNFPAVARAAERLRELALPAVLHCGDITAPETVGLFEGLPVHFVFGNCDHDQAALSAAIAAAGLTLHDHFGHLELGGKNVAFLHGHDRALQASLLRTDHYDFLFHGHTHRAEQLRHGRTRVINPGAFQRVTRMTFAVVDLAAGAVETVAVV